MKPIIPELTSSKVLGPVTKEELIGKSIVNLNNGCWEWQKARNHRGYGRIRRNKKTVFVHIMSYRLFRGPIPDGLFVLHTCDNPPCCNPDHLFVGTKKDNSQDCLRKGRVSTKMRKLTPEQVLEIRKDSRPPSVIARAYGVSHSTITHIFKRRRYAIV